MRAKASFASSVCGSDSFTTLPWDTQAIYYQLCFECDVDGFVANARRVIAGLELDPTEQLKRLVDAGLLLELEHGYLIAHYWHHNKRDYKNYNAGNHLSEIAAYLKKHTSCVYVMTKEQLDSLNPDCKKSGKSRKKTDEQSLNQSKSDSCLSVNSNVVTTISGDLDTFQEPTLVEALEFASKIGMDKEQAAQVWNDCYWANWSDKDGAPIKNWQGYFRRCKQNDDALNEQ